MTLQTTILYIFGTRPEAIKMAPLIKHSQQDSSFKTVVCVTAQHRQMLDQVLDFFEIKPDYDLDLMQPNQDLYDVTTRGLNALKPVLKEVKPDIIMVQGDTTTSFLGALAGYYEQVKVSHIEAGLRSDNKYSPYPEEMYRKLTGHISDFHFAPTQKAADKLALENISTNVFVTGNTVIDALLLGLEIIDSGHTEEYKGYFGFLNLNERIILITGHRRENFGGPLQEICNSLKQLAIKYPDVQFVYPVHLNPNVQRVADEILSGVNNVFLIEPLDYPHMIWLMRQSYFIVTDSGGVQEEAPSLNKPVLVTREVTERMEGVEAGASILVGTDGSKITEFVEKLLTDNALYERMAVAKNPYGDGKASEYILEKL